MGKKKTEDKAASFTRPTDDLSGKQDKENRRDISWGTGGKAKRQLGPETAPGGSLGWK